MKCVARVANRLSISEKTKHHALEMMEEVVNKKITAGKESMGLAARCSGCIRSNRSDN
jgi:transcription initiation factor TFIIB